MELADRVSRKARREFLRVTGLAQHYARNRERTKACWVRSMRLARPLLLELANRMAADAVVNEPADFFYLSWREVEQYVGGGRTRAQDQVAARRREAAELEKVLPPPIFEAPPNVSPIEPDAPGASELSGLGVSAGVATGKARVVRSAAAAAETELEADEVLIAPFTDAAWTPLFVPASAVVVETGGLLSHAAIVAREFGIPAVVAVKGATSIIRDGQTVTVDGAAGTVKLG
jgi:pyruvate,water dikinase